MVNFNFSFDPGTTLQQMVGFETAGRIWSSYLTDNITVNLQVGVSSSLGSNVIGGALPGISAYQKYSSFTSALKADATSTDDQTALKQVYGSTFAATYKFSLSGVTAAWVGTSSSINLTRADAKAVGLLNANDTGLDGYILFGSLAGSSVQWNYDYTRSAPAPAKSLDFLSTALHEIGHTLGFVSGLDNPGWIDTNFGFNAVALASAVAQLNVITNGATALDLFRYNTNFLNVSDTRDLSLGGNKVFSLGTGTAPLANFSTGVDTSQGGNGYEASHWAAGTSSIEAPTLKTGTRSAISAIDLQALDVIGYNLSSKGINATIDLSALQTQSKQALATRLGQTLSWLDANATAAAQALTKDRSADIYTMAANSQIYDLSKITSSTTGTTAKLTFNLLFEQQGLFETIDDLGNCTCSACRQRRNQQASVPDPALLKQYAAALRGSQSLETAIATTLKQRTLAGNSSEGVIETAANAVIDLVRQSVQPLTATTNAPSSESVFTAKPYYYGNSKPVAYEGSTQGDQQITPLSVLVNLGALL